MIDARLAPVSKFESLMDELHWVSRCRVGDETALGHLIARHRNRLVRTATNLLRDRHEAEDVSQEAFLKAFREIGRLRDDRAFSGYLYRICVRLCMDRLRLKRAEPAKSTEYKSISAAISRIRSSFRSVWIKCPQISERPLF